MNDEYSLESSYWDYVSSQDLMDYTDAEDMKSLIQSCYSFLEPFITRSVWVECNTILLNQIHNVSQNIIGDYLGISQYGVSKRLKVAIKRLKIKVRIPEQDTSIAKNELSKLFSEENLQIVMSYYLFNSKQFTCYLYNKPDLDIHKIVEILEKMITDRKTGILLGHGLKITDIGKPDANYILDQSRDVDVKDLAKKYVDYFREIAQNSTIGEARFNNSTECRL